MFLDIDGVLHPFHGHVNLTQVTTFHRECMDRLVELVEDTKAEIVLSSSWRNFSNTRVRAMANLGEYGITFTRWIEPDSSASAGATARSKVEKILSFVQIHNPQQWVVLDDEDLVQSCGLPRESFMMQLFKSRFVQTDGKRGLADIDIEQAVSILLDN